MSHMPVRGSLVIGDWVKLVGNGFIIYGKVVGHDLKEDQVRIITSTFIQGKPKATENQLNVVKIDVKEVPDRARMMILARISQKDMMENQSKPPPANLLPGGESLQSE